MVYAALLRGINVGGKNKIDMKLLKQSFERAGAENVTTYINSGNIIFTSEMHKQAELSTLLEQAILTDFGLNIKVLIRSLEELETVMQALPEEWSNGDLMKSDVMFLWNEADDPSVLERLPMKPGLDLVIYTPGAVLWSVDRTNVTRSGMTKIIGTALYQQMTIRNVNTTRKVYELMQAAATAPRS